MRLLELMPEEKSLHRWFDKLVFAWPKPAVSKK